MKIHTPPFILGRIANAPDDRVLLGWRYRRHRFLAPLQVAQVRFNKAASALQVGSVPASCTASARRHFLFFSLSLWLSLLCGVALIWNGALNTVAAATPSDASAGRKGGCASSGRERCSDGPVSKDREQRCWRRCRRDQSITLARNSAAASGRWRRAGMLSIRCPTTHRYAFYFLVPGIER